jgi:MFS family permease
VSVPGSDSGAPGDDRRPAPVSGAPARRDDEYGEFEGEQTSVLPRPAWAGPPDPSIPTTTALPRPARPPSRNPAAPPNAAPSAQGYQDPRSAPHRFPAARSTPARTPYPAPRTSPYAPPVGPSWAAQGPYQAPDESGRYDQAPYRQAPYDQAPYDQVPYDQAPYDQAPHDQAPYGRATNWADPAYDQREYAPGSYSGPQGQPDRGQGTYRHDEPAQFSRTGHSPADPHQPAGRGSHLPPYHERSFGKATSLSSTPAGSAGPGKPASTGMRSPRKLTVTRVAALRSRELTHRGVQMFHRATTADGADKSGLMHLTYAVMANYAVDAALAVALAGTLFFAAAAAESTGRVLLYLVITVAPFAVIAPFIGPMLDRMQSGRRLALAVTNFGRALLAILMAFNFSHFNPWVIYPCALGNLVLSKAFGVLKAALTPRVLPRQITLVKTNSRLTTFGMIAGGVAGALAAGLSKVAGSPGALFFTAVCAIGGGVLCLRIPAWVESTEGEVPVKQADMGSKKGFPQIVVATLWANSMMRVETGFLALFIAFVVKSQYPQPLHSAFTQLLLLGVIGAAAGVGGFVGNFMGARLTISAPEKISLLALVGIIVATVVAVLVPGLATAAIVGFVGSTASSLAKVSLDSVIQHHLPEESRASGFGKSESVLQLGWVFGGVIGLLLGGVWTFGHANVYAIGFAVITVLLLVGLTQSWLVRSGRSIFPSLPVRAGRGAGSTTARLTPRRRTRKAGKG